MPLKNIGIFLFGEQKEDSQKWPALKSTMML